MPKLLDLIQKILRGEAPPPPVAAMGVAYASTLEEGETFATLELKINFLRPVWNAHLRAAGKVVLRGR